MKTSKKSQVFRSVSIMASILLVVSMAFAPSAAAWKYFDSHAGFPQNPIKVCLEGGGFTTTLDDAAVASAVAHWDGYSTNKTFQLSCSGPTIRIKTVNFSAWALPNGAATTMHRSYGAWGLEAVIFVNTNWVNGFWFYTADQNCNVGSCAKPVDYYTTISHEIGHALGFAHNKDYPDPDGAGPMSDGVCAGGHHFSHAAIACYDDFYSVDIMYENSGDGYRRFVTQDSLNGLDALGYR